MNHSSYYDNNFGFNYNYDNRYVKEENNQKIPNDYNTNYMNQQPNNLMLLSQIINEPDMLIGTGINGQLTLNEEVEFLVKNPQYLSSSISNLKVNKNITQQLFARNELNRYPCKFCSQNFKRINGLKRHIMMHLNIKPYQCHICFRCFSRIDVFKRHLLKTKCVSN